MRRYKIMFFLVLISIFLSACSNSLSSLLTNTVDCQDDKIDWIDVLMINGIQYQKPLTGAADGPSSYSIENGRKIGEVTYKMADSACSDHKMRNGDATFLAEGTSIYEVNGYPGDLIVIAGNGIYVADTNKKAKNASELLPIKHVVKNIYIESTEDGSRIHTFSQTSKIQFIDIWEQLKVNDVNSLYKAGKMEGKMLFIEIELQNNVSFRLPYIKETNVFHNGVIGNKQMEAVIESEISQIRHKHLFTN